MRWSKVHPLPPNPDPNPNPPPFLPLDLRNPRSRSPDTHLTEMSKTLILPLLLLLLLSISLSSSEYLGLDAFLSAETRRDPAASNDSFPLLPSSIKKSLSLSPPPSDPSRLISHLLSLHISVPVHVKLVGPFSSSAPDLLHSFASAAHSSSPFHTIGPSSLPHHLALSHSLHLSSSLSALDSQISSAIRSHLGSAPAPLHRSALQPVPYSIVDAIVREDYLRDSASSAPGFYIYLLNLNPQSRPYAYSYDARGDGSPAYSKCLGSIWTGAERYMWIDLAAGPVDYGPALSGEGVLPRGEFHPLSALHRGPRAEKAVVADLASVVLSVYQALLVPSLRIPVYFENSLLIQFIHIHGSDARDPTGLDFSSIERTIRESGMAFGRQPLRFKSYSVKFSDCPICSAVIARSTNSFTSRFLFENYTLIVSEYLDSKRLHQMLSDSVEQVRQSVGVSDEDEFGRILPVYVFDLDYDKLLMLDRYHQAVAFRDMVIAVRTRSSQTVSDYSCNGRHVITQTRNLDRPILGSVLQSMWGITPTHLSWSSQHNSTLVDYTWSVGQTPFGPFSESLSLSFVQKDASKRNVLITSLNYTISGAIAMLESMASYGGDRKLLRKNRYGEFVQRWNLLKYKLEKMVSAMSQLDYDKALYFLTSSEHDLYAIHTLVYQASQEMEASLVCFKDPPFPWASACMAALFLFAFFYVYAKRGRIFKNKRKQF